MTSKRLHLSFAAIALSVVAGGCESVFKDLGREPDWVTVQPPAERARIDAAQSAPMRHESPSAASTWSDHSSDLFRDARAMRPGDVLTVRISIKDRASFANSANRSRDSRYEGQGKFGFGIDAFGLKKAGEGQASGDIGSKTTTDGRGAVTRSESIDLVLAAIIVEILPNGNLVIRGNQEVRLNHELRALEIEGIVRPRDIATDNSVAYEKIAEARVSYGGRGRTMEVLQPGIGQQIIDRIAPF